MPEHTTFFSYLIAYFPALRENMHAFGQSFFGQRVTADAVRQSAVILTNAVYFAGGWNSEFPATQTENAPFHLADGSTVNVPMMHHGRLTGAYRAGSNFEGAVLRYKQSGIFFLALLPKTGSSPLEVVDSLDPAQLSKHEHGSSPRRRKPKQRMRQK